MFKGIAVNLITCTLSHCMKYLGLKFQSSQKSESSFLFGLFWLTIDNWQFDWKLTAILSIGFWAQVVLNLSRRKNASFLQNYLVTVIHCPRAAPHDSACDNFWTTSYMENIFRNVQVPSVISVSYISVIIPLL